MIGPVDLRIALATLALPVLSMACSRDVPQGTIEVLEVLPHDSTAYTQGLVMSEGELFESSGRYGESTSRRLDPSSGANVAMDSLPEEFFAEGLAAHQGRLILLTWKEHAALVYDPATLVVVDTLPVDTYGWGLCSDGEDLFMTSGGSILYRRDPESLERVEEVLITRGGVPFWDVNELECVGAFVYGNVFQSTLIVQIEKASGEIVAEYDAAGLVPASLRGSTDAVLNGIAYDPESETFLLTGKLWPVMYRVRLNGPG